MMEIKKWTVKDIVEDFHNHQNYELHSSYVFVGVDVIIKKIHRIMNTRNDEKAMRLLIIDLSLSLKNQHNKKD